MNSQIKSIVKEAGIATVKKAALSTAVAVGINYVIPGIGLPAKGITAISLASFYKYRSLSSRIPCGKTVSLLQRAGFKGLLIATKVGIIAVSATSKGIYTVCKKLLTKKESNCQTQQDTADATPEVVDDTIKSEVDFENFEEKHLQSDLDWEIISNSDDL